MYLGLFFCLLGSVLSVPLSPANDVRSIPDAEYILPGTVNPTFYDVSLFLDPSNKETFKGNVLIRVVPRVTSSEIVLHAMNMEIESVQLSTADNPDLNVLSSYNLATDDTHFLRIESNILLMESQEYIISIQYTGTFAANMFGLYVSTYQHETDGLVNLIASQLQPTFARRAFPCFDEPRYKAVFRTTIYAPPQYTVVRTNMPLTINLTKEDVQGFSKHEFQDTPVMSTYLLAFLVSNFEYISNEEDMKYKVPFRVYARPGNRVSSEFALDYGQKNMIQLEKYIELPYDLPKIDKAAIPDFAAGAMENWGLVLYREVALLVTEGVTTRSTLQNIGRIICHENVHMWFGNEVSPLNWTYTWLNEGFANFFENYGTDLVLPEWRMMDQYVILVQSVFQNDAVLTVNPMTHPVYTPSQVIGTFNSVAYQKSGSVIRMLQHFLTPEVFRKGLVSYIKNNARTSVGPQALFQSLQEAINGTNVILPSNANIASIMERWTTQGGFPVLMVRRQAPSAESLAISQERFLTDPSLKSSTKWHVPVNWVISTDPNFEDTSCGSWVLPNIALAVDIPGLSKASWFIINKQQTGYYRVNYENENWLALAKALRESHNIIHLLNRAQIIDDIFNLARNGRTNYFNAFEVSRYLINETDYIPWGSANAAFNYLDIVLSGTPIYELFQTYVLQLTEPLYNQLGFEAKANEEHVTPFHRNIILNFNCRFGNEQCVNRSRELLQEYQKNPNQRINPDIQTTVFCSALRDGNPDTFNFLWEQYLASQDSSEQTILLNALGCTSNAELRSFYMNKVIELDSEVREQDRHTILVAVINSSPAGMEAALDFVIENFAAIQPRVQGLSGTPNILNAFARRLTSSQHSSKIKTFISRHGGIFTAAEQAGVGSIQENIAASINWSGNNYNNVKKWLQDRYGNSANIVTSSFLIVISIFVTIYNY